MSFKLSDKACQEIVRGNPSLAFNDELERLRLKLEATNNPRDTAYAQGQIYQLRQIMALHAKALAQLK